MSRTRTAGLVIAAVATLLWVLFLAALLTADPDEGANIGAGLAALLALPLSVASSVVLLVSLRARPGEGRVASAARSHRRAELVAGALAVGSVAAFGAFLVLDPYSTSTVFRVGALGVGVAAFLGSAAMFAMARPPRV